jgi:hypothetical protein
MRKKRICSYSHICLLVHQFLFRIYQLSLIVYIVASHCFSVASHRSSIAAKRSSSYVASRGSLDVSHCSSVASQKCFFHRFFTNYPLLPLFIYIILFPAYPLPLMVLPFLSWFIHCFICCSYSLYEPTWFLHSYRGLSIVSSVALIVYTSPHGSSNRLSLVFRLRRCYQLCAYLVPFYVPILFYCHPSNMLLSPPQKGWLRDGFIL